MKKGTVLVMVGLIGAIILFNFIAFSTNKRLTKNQVVHTLTDRKIEDSSIWKANTLDILTFPSWII
ncbi:hypothetical protein [Pseudalkalibacillus decolorationis]|uniref:hypothetical protein n=1 Tax=Pseudalkalibacillus decolorationis TaxID=163879 RepID=UPI002147A1D6|nr:hypothetical protein [Pseudalkalibacillus decolorationis]